MPPSRKPTTRIRRAGTRTRKTLAHPSVKQLRAIFHHALDAFLIADDQGNYVDANPAACAMLGYTRAELVRLTIYDTAPSTGITITRALWNDRANNPTPPNGYQMRVKEGRVLDVEYRLVANIAPHQHLIILRDQSEHARDERLHAALYRMSEAAYAAQDLDELYHLAHETVSTLMPARVSRSICTGVIAVVPTALPAARAIFAARSTNDSTRGSSTWPGMPSATE